MSEEKQQLTNKNEDFVFRFKKIMAQNGKITGDRLEEIVGEVTEQLLAAQGTGKTAVQLFGTPTQAAQKYLDSKTISKKLHDYKFSALALDTSLAIFMLFSIVFGISLFFSKQQANQGAGILSLLLIAALGGTLYTGMVLKLTPNPKQMNVSKSQRWLYLIGAVFAWVVGFVILGLIPATINPTLPPYAYIILAAIGYAAFRWNREKAGLNGGFFAISRLSQQARLDAVNNKK